MSVIPRRSHFILQRFSSSTAIKSMVVSAGANPTSSTLTNVSSSASPPMTQVDVPSSTLPSLTLYGDLNMRPFRNIWMLEELSIPYKHILCKPWSRIAKSVHPMGKVPALLVEYNNGESTTDDGVTTKNSFVVLESAAINTFVGDLSREYNNLNNNPNQTPILVPPTATRERAKYDSLAFFIMTEIDFQSLWIHRKHSDMSDVFGEAPVAVTEAKRQFDNALEAVEKCLSSHGIVLECSHSYCCGDSTDKQFIYCDYCKEAVSQEMFGAFHAHVDEENEVHSCPHATISPTFRTLKARKQSSSLNEGAMFGEDTKKFDAMNDQSHPSKKVVAAAAAAVAAATNRKDLAQEESDPLPFTEDITSQYFDF
eukprot:g11344.t1 g11344   contig5:639957-641526(-)